MGNASANRLLHMQVRGINAKKIAAYAGNCKGMVFLLQLVRRDLSFSLSHSPAHDVVVIVLWLLYNRTP